MQWSSPRVPITWPRSFGPASSASNSGTRQTQAPWRQFWSRNSPNCVNQRQIRDLKDRQLNVKEGNIMKKFLLTTSALVALSFMPMHAAIAQDATTLVVGMDV